MDLMWWDIWGFCDSGDGRLRFLFGKETDRLNTHTIFVRLDLSCFSSSSSYN